MWHIEMPAVIPTVKMLSSRADVYKRQGLFSNGRIARDNLPEGVYCYDLRGSDYDPGDPVCVEAVSYTHL